MFSWWAVAFFALCSKSVHVLSQLSWFDQVLFDNELCISDGHERLYINHLGDVPLV